MKIKNKGKVSPEPDALSVLTLLPAAILAVASLLSLEDREVLAYLITRSLKTTTTTTTDPSTKKSAKRVLSHGSAASSTAARAHKPPVFDCECFDCYTSYWFRWDSSPDRELINQAIEAFEDHLANGERSSKKATRGKRRDKNNNRRVGPTEKVVEPPSSPEKPVTAVLSPERALEDHFLQPEEPGLPAGVVDAASERVESYEVVGENEVVGEISEVVVVAEDVEEVVMAAAAASSHKGLARKVLPDVLGLFNSRLWSLWSPNVY